jgi:serine/threonine-protein kinase
VARELTRRHPDDFESWYVLGEVLYHWGSALGGTPRQALEAFDRAIGKDSLFAPAYIHPVELALWLDGPEAGHRYARRYVRLGPTDISAAGIRLVDSLMDGGPGAPAEIVQVLRGHAPSALIDAWGAMRRSSDSAEGVIAIARALVDAPEGDAPWRTQAEREQELGVSLLYRGHVGEAMEILYRNSVSLPLHLVEAALLRPAPDSAVGMFRQWIDEGPVRRAELVLPWLMARGDSVSIRRLERRADSLAARRAGPPGRNVALHAAAAARAYLSLLRRDTATAIGRFEALPDSLCPLCYIHHLTLARLYSATRADRKAAQLLDRWLMVLLTPSEVFWTLERARVAERLGDREKASRDYQYVVAVWRHAEPDLQPYVAEAREGLSRLAAEPRQ